VFVAFTLAALCQGRFHGVHHSSSMSALCELCLWYSQRQQVEVEVCVPGVPSGSIVSGLGPWCSVQQHVKAGSVMISAAAC